MEAKSYSQPLKSLVRRFHCRRRLACGFPLGVEGVLDSTLPAAIAPTVYARIGDIPAAVMVAVGLIVVLRRRAAKTVS